MEEEFYNEKLNAQEALEEGYIDREEYEDWISSIEAEEQEYYEEEW